jgi:hypothetical protein
VSAPAQTVWNDLRPLGSVDLGVHVRHVAGAAKPEIEVRVLKFHDNTSLESLHFPYRLEQLRGSPGQPVFVYRDGEVQFRKLRALHGTTEISADGYCRFNNAGAWVLRFDRITADRLQANVDLLAALPMRLKRAVTQLRPTGPIGVDGSFALGRNGPDQNVWSRWDIDFNLHQSTIQAGPSLANVTGGVRLWGQHDGAQLRSQGELTIDSLSMKDFHFTEVRGPLWIDDKQVIFGSQAETPRANQTPRTLTAKLYGGTVLADLWIGLNEPAQYDLRATLTSADLETFGREQLNGRQRLQGKVDAGLHLTGRNSGLYTMTGKGQIRLYNADIYELPAMVRLLSILSIRLPEKRGFISSEADFEVAHERVYLNRVELAGDAISLLGQGEVKLTGDVQATLSAIVGRSDWQLAIFKNMMGEASKQIMQIHVDGNLADLQIRREPFPVLNQALEQLQSGMQPRPQLPSTPTPQAMAPGAGRR